jgi:hypothetical protein
MTVLVDDAGRSATPDVTEIVHGSVRYRPADSRGRVLDTDFETRHQQLSAIVVPDPPSESATSSVELSMMVL